MDQFDIQRIENALWVLERYWNDLQDTNAYIRVDGVEMTSSDALKVLDIALYALKEKTKC